MGQGGKDDSIRGTATVVGLAMTTTREIDALLAEAIGCPVAGPIDGRRADYHCGCGKHQAFPRQTTLLAGYYSAPTADTMLQLIEGLAAKGWEWRIETYEAQWFVCLNRDDENHELFTVRADTIPAAVAEAARLALQIPEVTE